MSTATQNIVSSLDGLTPAELAEIAAQASARAALLGANEDTDLTPSMDEALVYSAVETALRPHLGTLPPFRSFAPRHVKYRTFKEASARLLQFVAKSFRPKNKPERVKAVNYLCGMLVRHRRRKLREYNRARPLDIFSFIDDMNRIETIVESEFPEYQSAGLLRILLQRQLAVA